MFSLKDKVILVTGGTGLLGKNYCKELANHGAKVVMADLKQANPKKIASSFNENNSYKITGIEFDVSNEKDVIKLLQTKKK